jgi:UDP-glucose 4-epimerase
VRFANAYGPGQQARRGLGVIAAWCEALAEHRPLRVMGGGEIRRDFIYADDAARAALAAAFDAPRPAVYNAGGGSSVSLAGLLELLAEVSSREPQVEHLPARAIDVLATRLDCTALRSNTGWEPEVDLSEGLARTWEWMLRRRLAQAGAASSSW